MPNKRNPVPTEKEAAWGERLYGCSLNEENLLPKQGFERQFLGRAGRNLIAVSTEISRLQFGQEACHDPLPSSLSYFNSLAYTAACEPV
jgi:hypothetical protein